jgi:endonuclease/exonuclease/phosphatase family metal-dependent hydrolase
MLVVFSVFTIGLLAGGLFGVDRVRTLLMSPEEREEYYDNKLIAQASIDDSDPLTSSETNAQTSPETISTKANNSSPPPASIDSTPLDETPAAEIVATNSQPEPQPPITGSSTTTGTGTSQGENGSTTPIPTLPPPQAPSITSTAGISASLITVSWGVVPTATQYKVEYASNEAMTGASVLTSGTNNASLTGLVPVTKYYIRVAAINATGQSSWSNIANTTTKQNEPTKPGDVSGLVATGFGQNAIALKWNAASSATSYTVRRATNTSFSDAVVYAPTITTSYTVQDLGQGNTYYFQVQANNNGRLGNWSTSLSGKTVHTYPSSTTAKTVSSNRVDVSWTAVPRANKYQVRYGTTANLSAAPTTSTSSTSLTLQNLNKFTTYYMQVRVESGAGTSSNWSNTMSVKTKQQIQLKIATFNILSAGLTDDDIVKAFGIQWDDRLKSAVEVINKYDFDIFGAQEVASQNAPRQSRQYQDLDSKIGDRYGHTRADWNATIPGDDEKAKNPIYYKKSKIRLVSEGTAPLVSTKENQIRHYAYALFEDKTTGKLFYVFNVHLAGATAEINALDTARVVRDVKAINTKGRPAFILGDFNSANEKSETAPFKTFKGIGYEDSYYIKNFMTPHGQNENGRYYSFQGYFNPIQTAAQNERGRHIDRIYSFPASRIQVKKHRIIIDKPNNVYPSDHVPVLAELGIDY